MASAAGHRNPKCHVLNFFYDDSEGCALTILVNEVRFHIIADGKRLRSHHAEQSKLGDELSRLLQAVKAQDQDFTKPSSRENLRSGSNEPGSSDSGHGTSERGEEDQDADHDSAVDVGEADSGSKEPLKMRDPQDDPEKTLSDWMLQPFGPIFDEKAPHCEAAKGQSVANWYERPTFFYSLNDENGKLKASEEEANEDLERRMQGIVPKLTMPKYIRSLDIPWFPADSVRVLGASDDPAPYHPSRVEVDGQIYFLKVVDPTQPQPTKREIGLMKRIEKLELHKQMNVPLVKGLVGFEGSQTEIIGFLQTEIEDPTPLTTMIDEDVPQSKRDKWAKESARIKDILHDNNIVWGDAKADNFMVDKHDKLWIIDFGGSYTDGWVDPELAESQEGDDMGVDKIIDALHDPVANTMDPTEDKTLYQEPSRKSNSRKRKVDDTEHEADREEVLNSDDKAPATKKRVRIEEPSRSETAEQEEQNKPNVDNKDDEQDAEEEQYCICNQPASGDMVGCDNDDCEHQWFHFECVGLNGPPDTKEWFCEDCRD